MGLLERSLGARYLAPSSAVGMAALKVTDSGFVWACASVRQLAALKATDSGSVWACASARQLGMELLGIRSV